jgi:hypothetical protein
MKEIKCFVFKETASTDNKVEVLGYERKRCKIKIFDQDGKTEIKEFNHVTNNKRIAITMEFE